MNKFCRECIEKEVPGLDLDRVWAYPKYKHIFPLCSLPKCDRDALKAAGYYWAGQWWEREWTEEEFEQDQLKPRGERAWINGTELGTE